MKFYYKSISKLKDTCHILNGRPSLYTLDAINQYTGKSVQFKIPIHKRLLYKLVNLIKPHTLLVSPIIIDSNVQTINPILTYVPQRIRN
jgi:hypothetical protein